MTPFHGRGAALHLIDLCLKDPSASVCVSAAEALKDLLDLSRRAALSWVLLRSLGPRKASWIIDALNQCWGGPNTLPALLNPLDEARFWAKLASRDELDAYAFAAFERMQKRRQRAFLRYVQELMG